MDLVLSPAFEIPWTEGEIWKKSKRRQGRLKNMNALTRNTVAYPQNVVTSAGFFLTSSGLLLKAVKKIKKRLRTFWILLRKYVHRFCESRLFISTYTREIKIFSKNLVYRARMCLFFWLVVAIPNREDVVERVVQPLVQLFRALPLLFLLWNIHTLHVFVTDHDKNRGSFTPMLAKLLVTIHWDSISLTLHLKFLSFH